MARRIRVSQIPVLVDNYVYVVDDGRSCFVVDPAEAAPVVSWLEREGLKLVAVVNTHHHFDHTGGNEELRAQTGCEIVGPARDAERIPGLTRGVEVNTSIEVMGLALRVLDVAAHTRGHIAFHLAHVDEIVQHGHEGEAVAFAAAAPALFVGDALFGAGCGKLFEGTAEDLHSSLSTIAAEDDACFVCCAHEYTASNLAFAEHAFPDVAAIRERRAQLDAVKGRARSSIPSRLGLEKQTNPFLLALRQPDAVNKAIDLRRRKDNFRA